MTAHGDSVCAQPERKPWSTPRVEALGNLHDVVLLGQGKTGVNTDGQDAQGNMMN